MEYKQKLSVRCSPLRETAMSEINIDIDEPWVVDRTPSDRYPIYTRANVARCGRGRSTT